MPTPLPFIGGAYDMPGISVSQAVNCYPEVGEEGRVAQRGVPGTRTLGSLTDIRGLHLAFGKLYAVAGEKVYFVSANGVATEIGSVANDGKPVSMAHNIFELLIVSAGNGYTVQRSNDAFGPITDPDFPVTVRCAFLDGYGLLLERDSGRFWFTEIDDFETITGTDFATAEGAPDNLVSLLVDHREVWLFGETSTEVWFNDGVSPFSRAPQGFIERGCRGAFSPAKLDNTVCWLGNDGVVYRAEGLVPMRISNHGVEQQIARTTTDPVALAYTHEGHAFYQLTFPGELTVVYDAATQRWHTRETRGRSDCAYHHHALAYGKHVVGGDRLYELDPDLYQHAGDELPRSRTIGPLRTDRFTTCAQLTFVLETGATSHLATEQKVFLDISDDGGRTFDQRIEGSVGRQGEYRIAVEFFGLGGYYDNQRCYRLSMTDDAKFTIVDAYMEVA